jgi:alpha-N-arabinofuranosidase
MNAKITIYCDAEIGRIDPDIYGHFLEMTYHCFYGGIWAEMLQMRKFEGPDGEGKYYGIVKPWFPIGQTLNTHFMHDNTIYYCGNQSQKIVSREKTEHEIGIGQDKLYFEKEKIYKVRLNIKHESIESPVTIKLEGEKGIYASHTITKSGSDWARFSFTLKSSQTDRNGSLTITFKGPGILWIGSVSLMPEDNLSGYRRDVIEAFQEIKPPNIRWPGGNFVSYYHWEDGIGDRDKRPPRRNLARWMEALGKDWESNDVGIDEFIDLCRLLETKPYIAVNSGDGTPEEAAHLVEYCNSTSDTEYGAKRAANGHPDPYNIELWGIGNEMFGDWQGGHVDEQTYARRHLSIAKAMRKIDPDIKIVATGGRNWFYKEWNQSLFQIAKGYFDYLSLHSYSKKYRSNMKKEDLNDPIFRKEFYDYIVSSPYGVEEQIKLTGKEIKTFFPEDPEIAIAFDEWNCWAYRTKNHLVEFSLRDGIYTAGILHAFRRQWDVVKLANFSMTINSLAMIRVNRFGMFFNPQYLVFKMYMNHQGPILIDTVVKCKTFPAPEYEKGRKQAIGKIPYIDASTTMSENNKTIYLSVINLHDSEPIEIEISLQNIDLRPAGKMIRLDGEDYMTENTFERPNQLTINETEIKIIDSSINYRSPPHSLTIFELYKNSS